MAEKYKKLALVASESVQKHTGKSWDKWVELLDKAGARILTHKEIAALLNKKYKLSAWWQQSVTVGYEQAIGRRVEGQNHKGEFATTSTKTLPVNSKKLWSILVSDEGQRCWLKPLSEFSLSKGEIFETEDGYFGEVRVVKQNQRARLRWQDPEWSKPSIVQIYLVPRKEKSILVFSHEGLGNARLRETFRERWKLALAEVAELIPSKSGLKSNKRR